MMRWRRDRVKSPAVRAAASDLSNLYPVGNDGATRPGSATRAGRGERLERSLSDAVPVRTGTGAGLLRKG